MHVDIGGTGRSGRGVRHMPGGNVVEIVVVSKFVRLESVQGARREKSRYSS